MKNKTILIQGALDIETDLLISNLKNEELFNICNFNFYKGDIGNNQVIISKTDVGTINSTISTVLGINSFSPDYIINQGIAGSHLEAIHTGDIIIGTACCNINSYSMPTTDYSKGSNPFSWKPNKRAKDIKYSDEYLVNFFQKNLSNKGYNIYIGILGSGDVFNKECDRILWIHNTFGTLSEDMESIGSYSVCTKFNIPCIGIRIISNNELLLEKTNKEKALDLQKLLINILENN